MRYRSKLLLAFVSLAALASLVVFAFVQQLAHRAVFGQVQQTVLAIAIGGANQIDGDVHAKIQGANAMESEAYRAVVAKLREIRDSNRKNGIHVEFAYTMRPTESGWIYVADAEEVPEDFSAFGDPVLFEAENPEDYRYSLDRGARPDQDFTHDEFGSHLSAQAPIFNSAGKPVALLGIDLLAGNVQALTRDLFLRSLGWSLFTIGLAASAAWLMNFWATQPLAKVMEGLKAIAKGRYETRLTVERSDEFGELETAVNKMAESLQVRHAMGGSLTRFVSRDIVREIGQSERKLEVEAGAERKITVLFCDLTGLENAAKSLSDAEMVLLFNNAFSNLVGSVFKFGGTLDRFFGAGFMATFGAVRSAGNQHDQAVRAALDIVTNIRRLSETPPVDGFGGKAGRLRGHQLRHGDCLPK